MFRLTLILLTAIALSACTDNCVYHLKYGHPSTPDQFFCRENYASGFNYHYKNPVWVAYHLTEQTATALPIMPDYNHFEKTIPDAYLGKKRDYWGSGFRYAWVATNAINTDKDSIKEVYSIGANTLVMEGRFFRTHWQTLANYERGLAKKYNDLYVVTGPLFDGINRTIGPSNTYVPSHYYRVFYSPSQKKISAVLLPHQNVENFELENYQVTVDELERMTGLDFFNKMLNVEEDLLESEKVFL